MGQTVRNIVLVPCRQVARFFDSVTSALYKLDPQPDLYIFAENNSTDGTLQLIRDFKGPKRIIRVWFRDDALDYCETRHDIMGFVRQFLLQTARQLDPDFAIFLDSDVRVRSHDLISRLTCWQEQADIVGGPYRRLSPWGVLVAAMWPGWRHIPARTSAATLEEVMVVGAGCMCLSRKVIQDRRLNFYPVKHEALAQENMLFTKEASLLGFPLPNFAEDVAYCLDAWFRGYNVCLDWSVALDHWTDNRIRPWTLPSAAPKVERAIEGGVWL